MVILHDLLTRGDGDPLEIEQYEQHSHLTVGDGLKPYVRASDVERRLGRMLLLVTRLKTISTLPTAIHTFDKRIQRKERKTIPVNFPHQ